MLAMESESSRVVEHVNQQVRSGRYQELFDKWVGGEAPDLTIAKAYR